MSAKSLPWEPRTLARNAPADVPFGYCRCGCGERAPLARRADARRGQVVGQPISFLNGHGNRAIGILWDVRDTGYRTPCWLWNRATNVGGYARRTRLHGSTLVHRQHYEDRYGPVPDGLDLDHLCRVRSCVNPDHVEPVTRAENARRGAGTILTLADVAEIRASTASDKELAIRYGVAPGTVWHVRSGNQWTAT